MLAPPLAAALLALLARAAPQLPPDSEHCAYSAGKLSGATVNIWNRPKPHVATAADCEPVCGNGVCECVKGGTHGNQMCCFAGYAGVDFYEGASTTERQGCLEGLDGSQGVVAGGPADQDNCPYDCGVPCPPFCDSEVCADGSKLYPPVVDAHELRYRQTAAGANSTWAVV